jgi:hypothetical protein
MGRRGERPQTMQFAATVVYESKPAGAEWLLGSLVQTDL